MYRKIKTRLLTINIFIRCSYQLQSSVKSMLNDTQILLYLLELVMTDEQCKTNAITVLTLLTLSWYWYRFRSTLANNLSYNKYIYK